MKMADLPGRVYSPIMGNEAYIVNARVREGAASLKKGQRMEITQRRLAADMNRKHGIGTFSTVKEGGKLYIVRNK